MSLGYLHCLFAQYTRKFPAANSQHVITVCGSALCRAENVWPFCLLVLYDEGVQIQSLLYTNHHS